MKRRSFLQLAGAGSAGILVSGLGSCNPEKELTKHRITGIKYSEIKLNWPRHVGKNAIRDNHGRGPVQGIHILHTDKGASGWGINRANNKTHAEKFELLKGKTIGELLDPMKGVLIPELEIFEFSLYDLAGKILEKPVYQLLGKKEPETFPCYSGMIYFDDLEPQENPAGTGIILEECRFDYNYGYRQLKQKIGRGFKWMEKEAGLTRDIEVTRLIHQNFPDCGILVDGNDGTPVEYLLRYLEGIGEIDLFWIEEPFRENAADYRTLRAWLKEHNKNPLLADGEANPDDKLMFELAGEKLVDVFLQDISGYGFTKWIKLVPEVISSGCLISPHAWGSGIKTNYISHFCGAFGHTATIEGVTCSSEDVDLSGYSLKEGRLIPSSKPGFGMDLLKKI